MPTYDYKCSNCNYRFEYFQPMTADPLTECPKCKGRLKRIIGSGAGMIFKGSGFYQTDYKSKPAQDSKTIKSDKTNPSPSQNPSPSPNETKNSKDDNK